ncbi:helix-turn-helix transcriptional regulator [Streptomyces sp. NPDC055400]
MDNRQEVREFLNSRRAKISPQRAGLPVGVRRRVAGLRRSEVAALADVSVEYYAKLERGDLGSASPAVLEAIARALQLDDAERAHLVNLARAAAGSDALAVVAGPAFVGNGRSDLLAANTLARALYSDLYAFGGATPNLARFAFLAPAARCFYRDWELLADIQIANLRTEAGNHPHNKDLHDLIGELSTRSEEFRSRWGAHDVRRHGAGLKTFLHPAVGELTLAYEGLEMKAEPGLSMNIYTAEPGSASEVGLRQLARWVNAREAQTLAEMSATD